MDNQDFSQLIDLFREVYGRIIYIKTQLTPVELNEQFVKFHSNGEHQSPTYIYHIITNITPTNFSQFYI